MSTTLVLMEKRYHGAIRVMAMKIVIVDVMKHVDIHANADDTYSYRIYLCTISKYS